MVVTNVGGVDVDFPFDPYECQKSYMAKVVQALQMKCDAALESPTGTGKTLSLLCSTLGWLQQMKMKFVPSLQESMALANADTATPLNLFPKIYYCSRTHSQLAQVIRELNKTVYKIVPTAVIGSRDQLCIHDKVIKEKDNRIKSIMCHSMVSKRTCSFYNKWDACKSEDLKGMYVAPEGGVPDIEDIVTIAKKHSHCPYFRTRQMQESAELILLPYNYLISPELRKLHKIDLKGSVVIFDEAHNLESVCEECVSVVLTSTDIAMCINELKKAIELKQEDDEAIRTEMDNCTEAFGKSKEASKKEEKTFQIGEAASVLAMLFELEMAIEATYSRTGEDAGKSYHEFSGKVFPGETMLDILKKAQFSFDRAEQVAQILNGASKFLHEKSEILGAMAVDSRGYLAKMEGFLSVVFASHPAFCGKQNVETKQVAFDNLSTKSRAKDFRLYMVKEVIDSEATPPPPPKITLNYWCFTAGLAMQSLKQRGVRSVIVTSGTLSPLQNFMSNIGLDFGCTLENGHAAKNSQVIAGIVKHGPKKGMMDGELLCGKFDNRGKIEYLNAVGESLLNVAKTVPQGVLVFFASYGLMNTVIEVLKQKSVGRKQSIWEQLEQLKTVVVEPRNKRELTTVRMEFTTAVRSVKGGMFMAVCRGKVSEGIDFADADSRAVVVVGIPYPPIANPRVKLKRAFLKEKRELDKTAQSDDTWYQMEGFRAVNQAIGRVLRHVEDFGVVVLLDSRFSTAPRISFSNWLRPSIRTFEKFEDFNTVSETFFRERGHDIEASRVKLQSAIMGKKQRKKKEIDLGNSGPTYDIDYCISLEEVPISAKENVSVANSLADLGEELISNEPPKRKEKVDLPASFGAVVINTEPILQPARKKVRLLLTGPKPSSADQASTSSERNSAGSSGTATVGRNEGQQNDVNVIGEVNPQYPDAVAELIKLDNKAYLEMLRATDVFNLVTSVLKAYKKGSKFETVYPEFKRLLLPSHPKLFIGLAKFLTPEQRQQVIKDGLPLL